jgi:uncharacterized membrane protein
MSALTALSVDRRQRLASWAKYIPVALLVLWYFSWSARLSVSIHQGYGTSAFDIGLYDQGLWLLSHFKAPFVTLMGRNLFGDHTSFTLLLLVPLYWIHPDPSTLLVVQALVLALAAVPVYVLALKRMNSVIIATVLAAALLLHPALAQSNMENYHPDSFLVLFVALAIYGALESKQRLFIVASVLAMLTKEDALLVVVPLGLWYAWRRNRKVGFTIAGVSVAWTLFATNVIMRALIGVPTLNSWRIPFGGPKGFVARTFTKPNQVAKYLYHDNRPWYMWQMLAPTGLVFLLQPEVAAIGVLVLASNVVSNFLYQHLIGYHYVMPILPALAMGTVFAVSKLRTQLLRYTATAVVGVAAITTAYMWGPYTFSRQHIAHWSPSYSVVHDINAIRDQVPPNAVLSSYHAYAPHLSHRARIYTWPTPFSAAYWDTFKQEGQRLPFANQIQYVILPTQLDVPSQEVWAPIRDDFEIVATNEAATLYKRIRPDPADTPP